MRLLKSHRLINYATIFGVILVIIAGAFSTVFMVKEAERELRNNLIIQAKIAMSAINIHRIETLSGSTDDVTTPDYIRLKEQLQNIKGVSANFRFVYLMGRKGDRTIFFYLDAESPESEDYSPPGQIYTEATDALQSSFSNGTAFTEGPVADRWGTWVSALVPITNPKTGKIIAVFGMDIDATEWNKEIFSRSYIPAALTIILLILIVGGILLLRLRAKKRESETKLSTLFAAMTDVVLVCDKNGGSTYFAPTKSDFITKLPKDLVGKNILEFLPGSEGNMLLDEIKETIQAQKARRIQYCVNINNTEIWYEASLSPLSDDKMMLVARDISLRKQAEKEIKKYSEDLEKTNSKLQTSKEIIEANLTQKNILINELEETKRNLEEAIKQKDKFFSIIAHDLKSPLSGVLGLTKILSEEVRDMEIEEVENYSMLLKEATQDVYALLINLLEWARLQRELVGFEPEAINLHQNAKNVINLLKSSALNKNIIVLNNIPPDLVANADVHMLDTILRNLISNAIKFTHKRGSISIEGKATGDCVQISVTDSGIGIPKEYLPLLFKVGEKTSRSGTEGETSTGLGLILCFEYIKKHKGNIWVESEEGKGTTFFFTIPKL